MSHLTTMKIAVQMLFFDCEQFILRAIANCAPWVDRIYVSTSRMPWGYNPEARATLLNTADTGILAQSPHREKIVLLEGDWLTETEQRNACLERAKQDGFDYLVIQDADEFYLPSEWEKNLAGIRHQPDAAFYRVPWYVFWKDLQHVLLHRWVRTYRHGKPVSCEANTLFDYSMCYAMNLRSGRRFGEKRMPENPHDWVMLPGICHHLSFVMNDEQMLRKISTWGHTSQVGRSWYRVKWLGWTEGSRDLGIFEAPMWPCAVRYAGPWPEDLAGFQAGLQAYVRPSLLQAATAALEAQASRLKLAYREAKMPRSSR